MSDIKYYAELRHLILQMESDMSISSLTEIEKKVISASSFYQTKKKSPSILTSCANILWCNPCHSHHYIAPSRRSSNLDISIKWEQNVQGFMFRKPNGFPNFCLIKDQQ